MLQPPGPNPAPGSRAGAAVQPWQRGWGAVGTACESPRLRGASPAAGAVRTGFVPHSPQSGQNRRVIPPLGWGLARLRGCVWPPQGQRKEEVPGVLRHKAPALTKRC